MKTRGIVGKRIVEIRQRHVALGRGRKSAVVVSAIELEGGIVLAPFVHESDGEPIGDVLRVVRSRKARVPAPKTGELKLA